MSVSEAVLQRRTGKFAEEYLAAASRVLSELEVPQIVKAAGFAASSLRAGGLIHVFGSGHSLLLAVETFFRAGGLAAMNPILDHRMEFDEGVLQSTEFERSPGAAAELAQAVEFRPEDTGIVISNSGRNVLPIEMAMEMCRAGMKVIAVTNLAQSRSGASFHPSGKRLFELADAVLDNHCPAGDAAVVVPEIPVAMGPLSTIAGSALLHSTLMEAAAQLAAAGAPPDVFRSVNVGSGDLNELRAILARYQSRIRYYRTAPVER